MRIGSIFLAVVVFTTIIACGSSEKAEDAVPSTILSQEKMVGILVKVHLTEAALNLNYPDDDKSNYANGYSAIFEKEGIGKEQYEESLQYYTSHPQIMIEIYDEVINELSRMQASSAENKALTKDSISIKK